MPVLSRLPGIIIALGRGLAGAVALTVFVIEDVAWAAVRPLMAALGRLPLVKRIEAWFDGLSPGPFLVLFLLPFAVVWPIKLVGLYLIGIGRAVTGTFLFAAAEIIGAALARRLWMIGRDRLLTIRWFAAVYRVTMLVRDRVYGWVRNLAFVIEARKLIADIRVRLRATFS